jgi:acid stress chaperone HdeB
MKRLLMLSVAAAMYSAAPAQAASIDLSTITCKKFFEYDKENLSILLTWLDGYYSEDDADPVIDFDKMTASGKKLAEYCGKNPDRPVTKAADSVWQKARK